MRSAVLPFGGFSEEALLMPNGRGHALLLSHLLKNHASRIHSTNTYLSHEYCVLGTVLSAENREVKR